MKKRLVFEVEYGHTDCNDCPLFGTNLCADYQEEKLNCNLYNMLTLKFIGEYEEDTKI